MAIKRSYKLNKEQRKIAYGAIDFVIDKFMPRLRDKLSIRITGIEELEKKEHIRADCLFTDDEERRARVFLIRVDNTLPLEEFLVTIMHELVHVKQWAKGEMYRLHRQKGMVYRWCGTKIKIDNYDYYDYPWEIEAHGREYGLSLQYLTKLKMTMEDLKCKQVSMPSQSQCC